MNFPAYWRLANMVLNDRQITARCLKGTLGDQKEYRSDAMINPFFPEQISRNLDGSKAVSYGVSSFGYDIRTSGHFKIFNAAPQNAAGIIDPKNFDDSLYTTVERGDYVILPPHSFALSNSIEYFRIPSDIITICLGKSTYARCGIIINVTPAEPGWCGHLTLEFSNTSPFPAKLYVGEGVAQMLFLQGEPCEIAYNDRAGKYQNQGDEPVTPRMK
jgi:dCTP deaminase